MEVATNTITITLPDDRFVQLKEAAGHLGVAPEKLAHAVLKTCSLSDEMIQRTIENLLKKNAELYQRLSSL